MHIALPFESYTGDADGNQGHSTVREGAGNIRQGMGKGRRGYKFCNSARFPFFASSSSLYIQRKRIQISTYS